MTFVPRRHPVTIECGSCGTQFESTAPIAKYCGPRCREKAKYAKRGYNPDRARRRWQQTLSDPERAARTRERNRAYLARVRAYLDEYKLAHGCVDCGYNENALALQFDHVGPNKTRDVSRCRSIPTAQAEIELCVVRCANCHHIKTHERRLNGFGNKGGRPKVQSH